MINDKIIRFDRLPIFIIFFIIFYRLDFLDRTVHYALLTGFYPDLSWLRLSQDMQVVYSN